MFKVTWIQDEFGSIISVTYMYKCDGIAMIEHEVKSVNTQCYSCEFEHDYHSKVFYRTLEHKCRESYETSNRDLGQLIFLDM